jgi:hypothetical protein
MNATVPIIRDQRATPQYQAQWRQRGQSSPSAVLALPPNLVLINPDRTPTRAFQGLYAQAWGESLPVHEPVCNADGTPSKEHLLRWS